MKPASLLPLLALTLPFTTSLAFSLFRSRTKHKMEAVVNQYFAGVNAKDPDLIRACFGETACIRDVCALNQSSREVPAATLVQRCMDFLAAHPDCVVDFYYGPECGRHSNWVVAHWYEVGTWSGESCGLAPTHRPMHVEGQTRFRINPSTLEIVELVVTRTFTEWEQALQERQQ